MRLFDDVFRGRRVLVSGHTGFKGSWLSYWLHDMGASVVGVSHDIPTQPSHFVTAQIRDIVDHHVLDIRDRAQLRDLVRAVAPAFVFHLAAQPLVKRSYRDPLTTFDTNVVGTLNVLEGLRSLDHPCVAVCITSDKCYENLEWVWGYRENDRLGGKDPYSASKGAAEILIRSYVHSFFQAADCGVRIGIGRAGNVIGGGDWAEDRIVPDCVRAWAQEQEVRIRSPRATRPWQHVLEPLSGYLTLAQSLYRDGALHGEPFNFGPGPATNHTVAELMDAMGRHWDHVAWQDVSSAAGHPDEAGLLRLSCDKAHHMLAWRAVLSFPETVAMTMNWYRRYYADPTANMGQFTSSQIAEYCDLARQRDLPWTSD